MDDAGLAREAVGGDGEAFAVLVQRYGLMARRVARAILGHEDDADDAVQDGFIAAWRNIGRYDPTRPFRPWLMRIVTNAALDQLRRQRVRNPVAVPESLPARGLGPEREAHASLLGDRLRAALAELPERQRIAVTLFDAEGYGHAEIAAILEVPEGTVRSYVFHARRTLRAALRAYREEDT